MKKISELPDCPVETALVLMGDRWKMLIVRDLLERTMRFGELQRSVGHISQKVLTQHLRALVESGLVHRENFEINFAFRYDMEEIWKIIVSTFTNFRTEKHI